MPQAKNRSAKDQRPTAPRSARTKIAADEIQKISRAIARERLAEESRAQAAIANKPMEATRSNTAPAHEEPKKAPVLENEFVLVDAPVETAIQNSANRFGLFSTIASSIGYVASYLNPFGKRG